VLDVLFALPVVGQTFLLGWKYFFCQSESYNKKIPLQVFLAQKSHYTPLAQKFRYTPQKFHYSGG
jgi:hypothetical protein